MRFGFPLAVGEAVPPPWDPGRGGVRGTRDLAGGQAQRAGLRPREACSAAGQNLGTWKPGLATLQDQDSRGPHRTVVGGFLPAALQHLGRDRGFAGRGSCLRLGLSRGTEVGDSSRCRPRFLRAPKSRNRVSAAEGKEKGASEYSLARALRGATATPHGGRRNIGKGLSDPSGCLSPSQATTLLPGFQLLFPVEPRFSLFFPVTHSAAHPDPSSS